MRRLESLAKKYLPENVVYMMIWIKTRLHSAGVFRYDRRRFKKHYSNGLNRLGYEHISARLTFHAHSLEKGLSHDDIRYGFGKAALAKLSKMLREYNKQGFDKSSLPYVNALSVLRAYIDLHTEANYDISYLYTMLGDLINEAMVCDSAVGGIIRVDADSKKDNGSKNFKELFMNRYSVRSYSDERVSESDINEAIEIAMKTPSICNRQSARVRVINKHNTIKKALGIQGGFTGYKAPPVLLVITTDTRDFVAITERNQVYVDGGLFAMSLLLALEYKKLAACPLNTMFTVKQDKAIRGLLNLEPSENIIMFASVGHFKESSSAPKSFRFSGDYITKSV